MTVITSSAKVTDGTPPVKAARRGKYSAEIRPLTATLECPAILDITFLSKLDMTSFTKKGLIAISKICGISLVKRTRENRKVRKCFKRRSAERERERESRDARKRSPNAESGDENGVANCAKPKRTRPRTIPKIKVSDSSTGKTTKIDVARDVCPASNGKSTGPRPRPKQAKPSANEILYGAADETGVAEPCKTCGRSEQPERFHSHPKKKTPFGERQNRRANVAVESSDSEACNGKRADAVDAGKNVLRRNSTGHLRSESASSLAVRDLEPSFHSDHEIESIKMSVPKAEDALRRRGRATKQSASPASSTASPGKDVDDAGKNGNAVECSSCNGEFASAKIGVREARRRRSGAEEKVPPSGTGYRPAEENSRERDSKYVTGCYVCGAQMEADVRIAHEKECIAEWRRQNSRLPPDGRKAEPLRPDFRFTAKGDVDFEGTFSSIWSNHLDSLVPCGKCGRTFFPERIERHRACCTGQQPKVSKHQTPRNK